MKISIVIPVYNEAEGLGRCLEAVSRQTTKPHQVIVVDNNSTDNTAAIAEQYPFVTLITEPRQGVVHARTAGFDLASGDVIARIDGDSLLPNDWLDNVAAIFTDPKIDAVSGVALYYEIAGTNLINAGDLFFRRRLSKNLGQHMYLWGANMAMRRGAWTQVNASLCQKGDQHEDFDVAIHLQAMGRKVVFDERLKANVSSRRIDMNFVSFMRYVMKSPNTYKQHRINVKRQMYPIVAVCALVYLPGYLLYRGYDPLLDRFSFSQLLFAQSRVARVDPTANVA